MRRQEQWLIGTEVSEDLAMAVTPRIPSNFRRSIVVIGGATQKVTAQVSSYNEGKLFITSQSVS